MYSVRRSEVWQAYFTSSKFYSDPFNDIELDFVFSGPDGERVVPAFWAGESMWGVRFSASTPGKCRYRSVCSDASNTDLHGIEGSFEVVDCSWDNPLLEHGRVRAASDKRHFEHADGTPFFWMGDTWWMSLCKRLDWPVGFQTLAADRVRKGFNVIQIVAGLYPDMPAFDDRGANEAGFPWAKDYSTINPKYFNLADRRVSYLVDVGLMPCIVGCWGYYLSFMGVAAIKKHWRNLIARWGAYPVAWCLAGEGSMPYYLSEDKDGDKERQIKGWTELAEYVRKADAFGNMITVHPTDAGRNQVSDPSVLDFDMLQTGHSDRFCLPNTQDLVSDAYASEPAMPFINAEVCYEGIGEASRHEVQRLMFWSCVLNGAAGHTYGANGIWQLNTRQAAYGPSPHGMAWGNTPWEDAYQLPGSTQVALGKQILEGLEWWTFKPHPEWVDPHWSKSEKIDSYFAPYCAGVPGKVRVVYFPPVWSATGTIKQLERGVMYNVRLVSPVDGMTIDAGTAAADENGDWELPFGNGPWKVMPILQDWVLIMEAVA